MLIFSKTTQQHCSCSTTPAQNNSSIIEHLIKLCWAKLRVSKSTRDDQNLFLSFTKLLLCLKPEHTQVVNVCSHVEALCSAPWAARCRWRSAGLNEAAASSSSEAFLFLTLSSPPVKHKTGRMMLFWLCRGDSRSAGRTSSWSCEQMCCCSGSYSLNDQSHQHKPINQHEPFRAPGAPEPRGLGAGASVARLVIQHLEHIELTNVHRRGYLWACWVICRSCRGSRLRAADVVMKATCRRRRTPDRVGVFL